MALFDTHTHFDFDVFSGKHELLAKQAKQAGIEAILIAGYMAKHFGRIAQVKDDLANLSDTPDIFIAAGLHPDFFKEHTKQEISLLEHFLQKHDCVALGEIGLDTYRKENKTQIAKKAQNKLFDDQLNLASAYKLPVLLHIRKSHAKAIAQLRSARFSLGGIAHSFSGGIQEAKKLVDLGFKIGVTGQVTNPNAKKLRAVVKTLGINHLVVETDCPDMLPYQLYQTSNHTINTPANLTYVVNELAQLLCTPKEKLEGILWQNSLQALNLST